MPPKRDARALWTRLRSMSGGEIRDRARQEMLKRLDLAWHKLNKTPRIPNLRNLQGSTPQFFFSGEQVPELADLLRVRFSDEVNSIVLRAERICAHRFDLLGYEGLDYGLKIDWHLDRVHGTRSPQKPWYKIDYLDFAEVGDAKIIWELNRHQHLVTLAKAYVLAKEERFAKEALAQWYDWIEQNPYPIGVNWASSLEVAFRVISWLWLRQLLAGSGVATQKFEDDLLVAFALSGQHIARYLSTYFSPNTHLLGEGLALFSIGMLCPEVSDSQKWQRRGWKIILQEAERQVRPDGVHFEQSNYYHVYALDMFLHAALLAARNETPIPERFERTLEKMLEALLLMSQAGISPRFGDDDGGRLFDPRRNRAEHMLDPLATGAVLFGRGDFKAAAGGLREEAVWLLGAEGVEQFDQLSGPERIPRSTVLTDSGFYVMAGSAAGKPTQLVIDAGLQGAVAAGHGHADSLSIQLSQSGRELLIDPGTFEYVGKDNTRDRFRGTAAHNTVQVDGRDQSEPKGPFSWKSLATPKVNEWVERKNFDLFAGSYETDASVVHRRFVFYCKPEFWLVRDVVEGVGKHAVTVSWRLAPRMVRQRENPTLFILPDDANHGIGFVPATDSGEFTLRDDWWSPAYGRKEPAQVLQLERTAVLPIEIATVLVPTTDRKMLGKLSRIAESGQSSREVQGYSYSTRNEVHRVFFAREGRTWSLQKWSSDAEFLYCREDRSGVSLIAFCNGSYVNYDRRPVLSARKRVRSCEVSAADREIISTEKDLIALDGWPEINNKSEALEPATARVKN
jgi:hypothetical protein